MAQRVNDFRIDKVSIPETQFQKLPLEARRRLEAYWEKAQVSNGIVTFELPMYRWEEIRAYLPQWAAGLEAGRL
jgi:hypothetical protein